MNLSDFDGYQVELGGAGYDESDDSTTECINLVHRPEGSEGPVIIVDSWLAGVDLADLVAAVLLRASDGDL